jgi:hypothetical protein
MPLVEAHERLPERMETAIWIRRDMPDVWLVEVLSDLSHDPRVDEPVHFNPGRSFRFPLHLIAGNLADVEAALDANAELAAWVRDGEIVSGPDLGARLQTRARHPRAA